VQVSAGFRGTTVRLRGAGCDPLVWVDGTPALAGYFDIDNFTPNTVGGIEIYSGVSEVPVELRGPRGEERCGVLAVWSRMPERKPRQSKKKAVTAEELNALIASATVYTADQVDRPVQVDSTIPVDAYYPDSLKQKHVSGEAVVEFVVDTVGRVETETINVVLASHPSFGRAAREAVWSARFVPAMLRGRTVRQLVQLPIRFQAVVAKR
jgi:TonB family protein